MDFVSQSKQVAVGFIGSDRALHGVVHKLLDNERLSLGMVDVVTGDSGSYDVSDSDVVLLHLPSDGTSSVLELERMHDRDPFLPIIGIIDDEQERTGIEAIRRGAHHVLVRSELNSSLLNRTIRYALDQKSGERVKDSSDHLFAIMLEYGLDIITLGNAEGTILYESPNLERITGFKSDERIGINMFDIIHPDDRARMKEKLQESIENARKPIKVRTTVRNKSGEWQGVEAVGRNFLDNPAAGCIVINSRILEP